MPYYMEQEIVKYFVGLIISRLIFSFIPAYMAKKKDKSFFGYYLLSVIISPVICVILVLSLLSKKEETERDLQIKKKAEEFEKSKI